MTRVWLVHACRNINRYDLEYRVIGDEDDVHRVIEPLLMRPDVRWVSAEEITRQRQSLSRRDSHEQ